MDRKIRVGAVSYLNTKPLIYGLEKGLMVEEIQLNLDTPTNIAQQLLDDEIDCGLVPVAIIPEMKEHFFVSDYGICCDGPVASVCIFSEVPLEQVTTVLMDYQSRTSIRLAKILLKEYWKLSPELTDTRDDFRHLIKGTTAAVLIGDRALEQRMTSAYIYDLGEAWKAFTGLSFVFATWISNKKLPDNFKTFFNAVNRYGLDQLDAVVSQHPYPFFDLKAYYTEYIRYELTAERKKGLDRYLEYVRDFEL